MVLGVRSVPSHRRDAISSSFAVAIRVSSSLLHSTIGTSPSWCDRMCSVMGRMRARAGAGCPHAWGRCRANATWLVCEGARSGIDEHLERLAVGHRTVLLGALLAALGHHVAGAELAATVAAVLMPAHEDDRLGAEPVPCQNSAQGRELELRP